MHDMVRRGKPRIKGQTWCRAYKSNVLKSGNDGGIEGMYNIQVTSSINKCCSKITKSNAFSSTYLRPAGIQCNKL